MEVLNMFNFDFNAMWFDNYKTWYECGMYTKEQLHSFVPDLFLSADGYEKITGEKYEESQG